MDVCISLSALFAFFFPRAENQSEEQIFLFVPNKQTLSFSVQACVDVKKHKIFSTLWTCCEILEDSSKVKSIMDILFERGLDSRWHYDTIRQISHENTFVSINSHR